MKEHKKLCRKMVSEIVCIFVCGHLSLWKDVYAWNYKHSKMLYNIKICIMTKNDALK